MVTLKDLKNHTKKYAGKMTREAQNSSMIQECLSKSLTEAAHQKIALNAHKYHINDKPDSLMYFKVIIGLLQKDTRAKTFALRNELLALQHKMEKLNDNIEGFNEFVVTTVKELGAWGQHSEDLLLNLFTAYKNVQDHQFITSIEVREQDYFMGKDYNPEQLMDLALDQKINAELVGSWKKQTREH